MPVLRFIKLNIWCCEMVLPFILTTYERLRFSSQFTLLSPAHYDTFTFVNNQNKNKIIHYETLIHLSPPYSCSVICFINCFL